MASLGKIITNEKRKRLVAKYAGKLAAAKATLQDPQSTHEAKIKARRRLESIPRNARSERVRNRCALTGRPRGFLRKFGLSRLALRKFGLAGDIPGLLKSSW